ncbi:MAG: carboxypeptidase-like regulatory domain-containing protein, partial [Chitinophagaceae bacterium]|nr:carboxypeptidase-like regulatory domain-containing protein [Chitinophagaceae bacterium]
MSSCCRNVLLFCLLLTTLSATAQRKTISGIIKDAHSEEPVPFASVSFKNTTTGNQSDSAGVFRIVVNDWPSDSLEISCVGYQTFYYKVDISQTNINITITLERGT